MLIKSNGAVYEGMPVFGNILKSYKLRMGLRATSPSNLVNLSGVSDESVLDYKGSFSEKGFTATHDQGVITDLKLPKNGFTIRLVCSAKVEDKPSLLSLLGDYDGNSGVGLLVNFGSDEAEIRFYYHVKNVGALRRNEITVIKDTSTLTNLDEIVVEIKVVPNINGCYMRINGGEWQENKYSGDDVSDLLGSSNFIVGGMPRFKTSAGSEVTISEFLLWEGVLSDVELDKQEKLSNKWLSIR